MELTIEDVKTAVHADSHTFAILRGRVHELRMKGQYSKANALQADYNERLERWEKKIKSIYPQTKET
jgi:hypothetical protein